MTDLKERIAELEKELERERLALGYESEYNVIIIERYCSNIRGKLAILRELQPYVEGLENDVSTLAEGYGDGGEWIRNLKKSNEKLQKERDFARELAKKYADDSAKIEEERDAAIELLIESQVILNSLSRSSIICKGQAEKNYNFLAAHDKEGK